MCYFPSFILILKHKSGNQLWIDYKIAFNYSKLFHFLRDKITLFLRVPFFIYILHMHRGEENTELNMLFFIHNFLENLSSEYLLT